VLDEYNIQAIASLPPMRRLATPESGGGQVPLTAQQVETAGLTGIHYWG
jgi:hypothetical protein